jgi:hypothetical protein
MHPSRPAGRGKNQRETDWLPERRPKRIGGGRLKTDAPPDQVQGGFARREASPEGGFAGKVASLGRRLRSEGGFASPVQGGFALSVRGGFASSVQGRFAGSVLAHSRLSVQGRFAVPVQGRCAGSVQRASPRRCKVASPRRCKGASRCRCEVASPGRCKTDSLVDARGFRQVGATWSSNRAHTPGAPGLSVQRRLRCRSPALQPLFAAMAHVGATSAA